MRPRTLVEKKKQLEFRSLISCLKSYENGGGMGLQIRERVNRGEFLTNEGNIV